MDSKTLSSRPQLIFIYASLSSVSELQPRAPLVISRSLLIVSLCLEHLSCPSAWLTPLSPSALHPSWLLSLGSDPSPYDTSHRLEFCISVTFWSLPFSHAGVWAPFAHLCIPVSNSLPDKQKELNTHFPGENEWMHVLYLVLLMEGRLLRSRF